MKNSSKKLNPKKKQRIKFILISSLISLGALFFIVSNFKENIVFFYSPSELRTVNISENKIIRVGGLVKENSIKSSGNRIEFIITDFKDDLKIEYSGIKPDLFREKQGVVAKGIFDSKNNIFVANELLAKHDEKYMPPEVSKAIKKNINYQENHKQFN